MGHCTFRAYLALAGLLHRDGHSILALMLDNFFRTGNLYSTRWQTARNPCMIP